MKKTLMLLARGYIHGIKNGANIQYKCQYLIKRKLTIKKKRKDV